MTELFPNHGHGLVIVAHPDDETLWCGGFILQAPELTWTIVSLCRGSDPDRRPRFNQAVNALGATGHILDIDDSPELKPLHLEHDICRLLRPLTTKRHWDLCLTHGKAGEYGHQRHKDVYQAVMMMNESGQLQCHRFWTFAYTRDDSEVMMPAPDADSIYKLNTEIFSRKTSIIRDIYGFTEGSFEAMACQPIEAFYTL